MLMILSGLWLSRTGRPLNVLLLTIHKLISLAAVVYLVFTVVRIHQVTPLNAMEMIASAVTLILFLTLIATGGLLSAARPMPGIVLKIHQIVPGLVFISTAITLYLLLIRKL